MYRRLVFPVALIMVLALASAQADDDIEWIRAAYWDADYSTAWAGDGAATRDALEAEGYTILDAEELKTWMDDRIRDKETSVVIMIKDAAPDTVCETMSATCTLRKYLDAGGKIVWQADIPFYYQGHADNTSTTWGDSGAPAILGFNTSSAPRDSGQTVTLTPEGIKWGLTQTWVSQRPAAPNVTSNLTILAVDAAGNAGAWVKHYVANDNFRGFVRLRDTGGQANVQDMIRLAEYVGLKASNPSPADGATAVIAPLLTWDNGSFALFHDLYFGTNPEPGPAEYIGQQFVNIYWHAPGISPGVTYYWRIDEIDAQGAIRTGDVWSFTAAPLNAFAPMPRDGDKWIDPNTSLSWTAGHGATGHDVYFSTDEAAVIARDALAFAGNQVGAVFEPSTLLLETKYFWAVDEILGDGTKEEGAVWSFVTAGGGGGVKGEYFNSMTPAGEPALTRIDPDINFNWGDPGGPGAPIGVDQFSARWTADLEIAVADTYTFITNTDDGTRLWLNEELIVDQWVDQSPTDARSQPIDLQPGVYSLVMEYYENGGGAVARLDWQTPTMTRQVIPAGPLQPPVRARAIYPADNEVDVPQDVTLLWSPGEQATSHQIYFGQDEQAVAEATTASPLYQGSQPLDDTSFAPGTLEWNKLYYWRVDEVNPAEADSPWKGPVWSFTTANFLVIENFELYNDDMDAGTAVFQTWLDGFENGTGSTVGYLESSNGTFNETIIVHTGAQSMPFDYDNTNSPWYSETSRRFSPDQDWSDPLLTDLTLFISGYPPAPEVSVVDGALSLTGSGTDIWGTADQFSYAYKTLNGDGSITARVVSNGTGSNTWAKGGVMIRDSLDAGSMHAMQVITAGGGNGASFQRRTTVDADSTNTDATEILTPPYWVKIERNGSNLIGSLSPDGNAWTTLGTEFVMMTDPVHIGLAVTSHAAGEDRTFEFDNIVTSGGVSGQWQGAAVGLMRNSPGDLYVGVEDSSGKTAFATNPDAVNYTTWTEWKTSLAVFQAAGVNLGRIRTMYIGVGDPANPTPDGTGLIYIDDIRVAKPE